MALPSFTITGTLLDLLGNTALGEIVGNGLGGATPATVTFTSNVPAGYFVTFDGAAYRVDSVTADVNSDGTITRNGEPVLLLANDAGLSVDGVQWQIHASGMNRFWANAPADGGTLNLGTVAPTPGLGVSGVAFSEGELVTLLSNSGSSIRAALDALYVGAGAGVGVLKFKGSTDCSANPNYPAASKGEAYVVTVAGKIGGASGKAVDIGDVYLASADNAGGTQASVGASWAILEHNLLGALLSGNNLSDIGSAPTARANLGAAGIIDLPSINVKLAPYSATGNGSTDDTATCQAALDACSAAGGGTVFFPKGTYIANLTYYSNVTIEGAGTGSTTIKAKAASTTPVLSSYHFSTLTGTTAGGGVANARIRNLSIDGNKANCPSGGTGISVYGPTFIFENVDVHDCHGHGFVFDYGDATGFIIPLESHVINCRAYRGDADGFHVLGAHDSYARGCIAAGNALVGINAGGSAWNWTDCHSWGIQQYAWQLSGINFLTNCHGEGATITNFFIDWTQVSIIGGSCFAPGGAGAKGMDFAAWAPEQTIVKGMSFYGFDATSGVALDLTYLGPQSHIDAMIGQAAGPAIAGIPPADAYVNVQVGGGTPTPSLVQIPGYMPPASIPAVYDSFTAANSSAPDSSKWTAAVGAGAAAAVNVQGNALQLKGGADGGYSSADFVTLASTLGSTLVDAELLFCLTSSSVTVESYLYVGLRAANANPTAGASGYILKLVQNTNSTRQVILLKRVASSNTTLYNGPFGVAVTNGQKIWFRLRVQGTTITLRTWPDGSAEPIVPTWTGTDSSVAGGGLATFALGGGAAAANGIQKIDNVAIYAL